MTFHLTPARKPPYCHPDAALGKRIAFMSGVGISQVRMADIIGISPATMTKHYRREIDSGREMLIEQVGGNLFEQAMSNRPWSVPAAIFILKTQGGWKEPPPAPPPS